MWVWDVTVCTKKKRPESQVLGLWGPYIKLEWMVTFGEIFWLFSACTHMLKLGLTLIFFWIWQLAFYTELIVVLSYRCLLVLYLQARQKHSGCSACALIFYSQPLKWFCMQRVLFLLLPPPLSLTTHYNCISLVVAYCTNIRRTGRKI